MCRLDDLLIFNGLYSFPQMKLFEYVQRMFGLAVLKFVSNVPG
jgi:hypothetical protein